MTYSSGPGGYGDPSQGAGGPGHPTEARGYGQQAPSYSTSPGQAGGKGLPFFLNLAVVALGVISFFLGFAPFAKSTEGYGLHSSANFFQSGIGVIGLAALLAAALVAAFTMLPKQEPHDSVVAALSVTGFISLLFLLIGLPEGTSSGIGLIVVLVTSFLQSAVAIAALLLTSGVIKPPQPRQANYGYYGQGGYGQSPLPPSQSHQPYYGGGGGAPGSPGTAPPSYQHQPPPSQQHTPQNPW